MNAPSDPRSIVIAQHFYRMLLATYPRRFRQEYRGEMALVFRDCCREAYHAQGARGLLAVSGRALVDLVLNAPGERVVQLIDGEKGREPSRSCSGCYSEVRPDWRTCKICGTYLDNAAVHETHTVPQHRQAMVIYGWRGVNQPLRHKGPH